MVPDRDLHLRAGDREQLRVRRGFCIHQAKLTRFNSYGFKASFNPSHPGEPGNPYGWWVSAWHFGLNQGPVVLMIENHRSGLLWELMRSCPYVAGGLKRAGFTGGWLRS